MYKTAMLGCGGRARGHADAYRFVKRGKTHGDLRYGRRTPQQLR